MAIFDDRSIRMAGSRRGRSVGLRADAEAYAASLGLSPGAPGWGDAIRDYALSLSQGGGLVASEGADLYVARAGRARPIHSVSPPGQGIERRESLFHEIGPQSDVESFGGDEGEDSSGHGAGLSLAGADEINPRFRRGPQQASQAPVAPERTAAPPPPTPSSESSRETVMRRIRGAESASDSERNRAGSNATGRYQFMPGTFVAYYRRAFPGTRESDAQIRARIRDGEVQDRVMNAYLEESEERLTEAGFPVTPGNLYLLHVAGHPVGMRILRNPDRPIGNFFSPTAIRQNRFGTTWTGSDVADWAERRVNPGPVRTRR
jgi:hypothetical protein